MLGACLAFVSAAFFGLNNATVRRGVLTSTVLQGMAVTVPLGVPLFAAFAFALGGFQALAGWPLSSWLWMALAGVVHFVIGRYGNYRATQALGATLSTPIQQLSILVALALAFAFLGESVNAVNLVGIVLVIAGPVAILRRRRANVASAKARGFEPDYLPGFGWGVVCAVGYGTSPLLISLALREAGGGIADSAAGVLVSYLAATVVVALMVAAMGGRRYMAGMGRAAGGWFLISALLVAMSQLLRYLALAVAPVAVVVPIQRLSVVFRLLFNGAINRDNEVIDRWVIASIVVALAGVAALSADTRILLSWLAVPPDWREALSRPLV